MAENKKTTAIQKLRVTQKAALAKLPRNSKQKQRIKERQKAARESLKKDQHLLSRARAALPLKQRKKLRPVRELSPSSIKREVYAIKNKNTKLAREKRPIRPPKEGRVTVKCFSMPGGAYNMQRYLNAIAHKFDSEGGLGVSSIRGWRAQVEYENGRAVSTGVIDPEYIGIGNPVLFVLDEVTESDPTFKPRDYIVKKICITIAWSLDYLTRTRGTQA